MILISRTSAAHCFASALRQGLPRSTSAVFFSTTQSTRSGCVQESTSRAIAFKEHGDPITALSCYDYALPALVEGEVRVKFELSAVNPADINVIQGVYPIKPAQSTSFKALDGTAMAPITIVGNEACGIVEGTLESKFKVGDRVIMGKPQLSTWQSRANLPATSLIRLPATPVISVIAAATLSINPLTAYRLLSDFVPLNPRNRPHNLNQPPQFVIQNAANSAVGEAVIQIGKLWKVKTINLIRDREDIDAVKLHLSSLGADVVLTYSEFLQRESRSAIKELVQGAELRLALNCVGGDETTEMAKLLNNGHLVTYGGMAKRALKIPPSLFIFKQLTLSGFWLANYVDTHPLEKLEMIDEVVKMISLLPPATEIIELGGTTEHATEVIREVMRKLEVGKRKKVLLKFD